jgi:diguanylate cyclase (GGDEF)-like protein/PAS domain S-box-containing protein
VPLLLVEPLISTRPAIAIVLPAVLALLVAGARTVLTVTVLSHAIIVWRAPGASPYLDPSYLVATAVLVVLLVAVERFMNSAIRDAERAGAIFEAVANEGNEVITITGPGADGRQAGLKYVSPSIAKVLGYGPDDEETKRWTVIHPDDLPIIERLSRTIRERTGASGTAQVRMRHKDGSWRWMLARGTNLLHHAEVQGVVAAFVDVTPIAEEREGAVERLRHEAAHDHATGLPNRRSFHVDLEALLPRVQRGEAEAEVIMLDLDGFKVLNDGLGHDFGDRLVMALVERVRPELGGGDTFYRFGGDELVVLSVREAESDDGAPERLSVAPSWGPSLAQRIVELVRKPFELDDRWVFVTASCGVAAVLPEQARPEDVLRDADVAMYRAKERGKDRVEIFDDDMRERALRRHELEQALRSALRDGELSLVYQPRVSASDGSIVGFEALARWKSAKLGLVGPVEFIPLAEETGLIVPIGRWVLHEACRQLCEFKAKYPKHAGVRMSVNVSGKQLLGSEDFVSEVRSAIAETGIDPWCLELEVTESILVGQAERSIERLGALKALGVKIGIDDFGTGYSSLSHLRKLPVDVLKVDRAFVMGLGSSPEDAAIVHLVIMLAQALGLETVAEGVETEQQLEELRLLGCDEIQGYLIAKPLLVGDALAYLERHAGGHPSARPAPLANA